MTRWLLVLAVVTSVLAEDQRALADRQYAMALTTYQQAEVDDGNHDVATARRHIAEAKAAREAGLAAYRALPEQPDPEVVLKRSIELDRLGKACCGRESLWERYR